MYLKEFHIQGYRSIEKLDLYFNAGVNVLIGRNNTGKTAIIDALRLCLGSFNWERKQSIWFDINKDFYIDTTATAPAPVEETIFSLVFDLPENESFLINDQQEELKKFDGEERVKKMDEMKYEHKAPYLQIGSQLENGNVEFKVSIRFYVTTIKEKQKLKKEIWFGNDKSNSVSSHFWELLKMIYLQPLRDAVSELQPPSKKIGEHFELLCPEKDKQQEYAESIRNVFESDDGWNKLRSKGCDCIKNPHLDGLSLNGKNSNILIEFLPLDFRRIVNSLCMQIPSGNRPFELDQNGLGSNNIIYAATVLAALENDKNSEESESFFLLIEEPEAHLHPQSQNQFFEHLNSLSGRGYQIFITSHSPTLTAKSDMDNLIVLQEINNKVSACHIAKLNLPKATKQFLKKFLDVTKSQLFFSDRVLFVEGPTEALLMQKFSELMDKKEQVNNLHSLTKNGVEIVDVGGVSFRHFVGLFKKDNGLISKYSIITDGDQNKNEGNEADRIVLLRKEIDESIGSLKVAENNFEFEIYNLQNNREVLHECWKKCRPTAEKEDIAEFKDNPIKFQEKVGATDKKTDLALFLLEKLEEDVNFEIPKCYQEAISHLIIKKEETNESKQPTG